MDPIVEFRNLRIEVENPKRPTEPIVQEISFDVKPGEVVALIGESGSGKTTIALSSMGYARPGLKVTGGSVLLQGQNVFDLQGEDLRAIRGSRVTYVAQSAAASFNPAMRITPQVIEPVLEHGQGDPAALAQNARGLYAELSLPHSDTIGSRFPHEVSGGQLQRLMAAMAMVSEPELIVFDEPTTALDVTTQITVLQSFKSLIRKHKAAAIYVSHDLALVAQIADRVIVLLDGKIQEAGPIKQVVEQPQHDYTKTLMAASDPEQARVRNQGKAVGTDDGAPVVTVRNVVTGYGKIETDGMPTIPVVKDVSIDIHPGEIVGIIGESGSGKSTLARCVAGLLPIAKGSVELHGKPLASSFQSRSRDNLRRVQIVYQMADTALNPNHTIGKILGRPITYFQGLCGKEKQRKLHETLDLVGLPHSFADRRPGELSGGQKQRVNLARALAADPDVILCDEVTSALDSVVREQVIDLLHDLRSRLGLSIMFITHDISVVAALADKTAVMYQGQVVEHGATQEILSAPQHDYTKLLVGSVPHLRVGWLEQALAERSAILGENAAVTLVG